jgi:hypothetical protein
MECVDKYVGSGFTSEHEVLTMNGWKNVSDLQSNDKIATLNTKNDDIEFQKPKLSYFKCSPDIIDSHESCESCDSRFYDIATFKLKNHKYGYDIHLPWSNKLYLKQQYSEEFESIPFMDIINKRLYENKLFYKKTGINSNEDIKEIDIPNINSENMQTIMQFLGVYMASGEVFKNIIKIPFNENSVINMLDVCNVMNLFYQIQSDSCESCDTNNKQVVVINNEHLACYLEQFGDLNNRRLPEFIFHMSGKQSYSFLRDILIGFGNHYNRRLGFWNYNTASKQMMDDMQRLVILSETSCNVIKNEQTGNYDMCIDCKSKKSKHLITKNDINEKLDVNSSYIGNIYEIFTENKIIMVRHNNQYIWCCDSN